MGSGSGSGSGSTITGVAGEEDGATEVTLLVTGVETEVDDSDLEEELSMGSLDETSASDSSKLDSDDARKEEVFSDMSDEEVLLSSSGFAAPVAIPIT